MLKFKNYKSAFSLFLLVVCLIMSAAGCSFSLFQGQQEPYAGGQGADKGQEPGDAVSILRQARKARGAGDLLRAERLYLKASGMRELPGAESVSVWRELAEVANANAHPNLTIKALESWKLADIHADGSQIWQALWLAAAGALEPMEARVQAQRLYEDNSYGWSARGMAGTVLAGRFLVAGQTSRALQVLNEIAETPESKSYKSLLEHRLYSELQRLSPERQANLAELVNQENETRFPFNIFAYALASRQYQQPASSEEQAAATVVLERLRGQGVLTGPAPLKPPTLFARRGGMGGGESTSVVHGGAGIGGTGGGVQGVALLTPLSGALGNMGRKIAQGARIAQDESQAAGNPFSFTVIDSDLAGWQDEVANLPEEVRVVGGPLAPKLYAELKAKGLTSRKVFFTFLQGLEAGDEGYTAWRFFASPNDQIEALLRFSSQLGVTGFASYHPDDAYGKRMNSVFESALRQRGHYLANSASYPANGPQALNASMAAFLHTNKDATKAPNVSHQAVFLPDSWKMMEIIAPTMFYFQEPRQLLLGTTLWEQGIKAAGKMDARYYNLAVFPVAWLGGNQAAGRLGDALAQSEQTPDLWIALGYDFARFASRLGVGADWNPAQVNSALSGNSGSFANFDWSMAPIRWDVNGIARQELYLVTPVEDGIAPADIEIMRKRFAKAWGRK